MKKLALFLSIISTSLFLYCSDDSDKFGSGSAQEEAQSIMDKPVVSGKNFEASQQPADTLKSSLKSKRLNKRQSASLPSTASYSSSPSPSSSSANGGDYQRLKTYQDLNPRLLSTDPAEKQKAVQELLQKMGSGEIPQNAMQDYNSLRQKYNQ
jgi:hypothetical protein